MLESVDQVQLFKFSLTVFDPRDSLALRIDHEGVARRLGYHDSILDAEIICREALEIPLPYGLFVNEEGS